MSNDIQSARNSQPIHGLEQVEQRELVPQGTFQGRKVTLLSSSENKQARMSSKRELSEYLNQFASLESCNQVLDFEKPTGFEKQSAAIEKLFERKIDVIARSER
ncbi:T3SS regulon translocated regulator ExsE2 [Vibrio parahaemolyticus]|nr:T3SS regulon translocated regulator ExsE2 [Vibrio parahaemolyticus]MBM4854530.1 T3SS regulon translocated regulator ExsE2 [Vibrio parahaemolyticus]